MIVRLSRVRWTLLAGISCLLLVGGVVFAQGFGGQQQAAAPSINMSSDPTLAPFKFRPIGPATMGGRIDDIQGNDKDPSTYYVGYAVGGLWKTTNNGTTWTELFGEQPVSSIGSIALAPSNPDIVYVGTGEANNRQSSTIGNGVYKSTDAGKTWTHVGLDDTQSIARVVVSPLNPDVVYVAAMGHLFGPNDDRGVFKSVDGGKTWKKTLFVNNYTGATDIAIDYTNSKVLWAATYQRLRTGWGYNGGGDGSGIWQSIDGGDTWKRVTGNGLPDTKPLGRIALAISRSNPKVVMAQIEVGPSPGEGANVAADGGPDKQGDLVLTAGQTNFSDNPPAAGVGRGAGGGGGRGGNQAPPDPTKSGIWRSEDAGKTWTFTVNNDTRPMYYTQLRIDPANDKIVWTGGLNITRSMDGGKTFQTLNASHTDNHALWVDPKDGRHVMIGHDGGLDITWDGHSPQVNWDKQNFFNVGLFYAVSADMRHPYHVCGGLQDNGSWCGPSALRTGGGGRGGGGPIVFTDWISVGGGDGFYTQNDPSDWSIFYTESQQGAMGRYNLRTGQQANIQPRVGGGGGGRGGGGNVLNAPHPQMYFRFYWDTPILISPHDPATIYTGAQYFFKSTNRGDTWTMNSNDLTKNVDRYKQEIMGAPGDKPMASKHDGYENNSNIVTIAESPARAGVIWVGTDDGNLQVSQDGGDHFTNVFSNIQDAPRGPLGYVQIDRIEASHFDAGTAYVAIDNHRNDDWKPYIYKTTDFGKSWTLISSNLPKLGHVNVVREDMVNPNLLFAGTEFGLFTSLDGGREWKRFENNMPNVRVDDILIHPRDHDLIVATHARSIWIMDDITPLEQMAKPAGDIQLFEPRPAVQWKNDIEISRSTDINNKIWRGQNPQSGTAISVLAKNDAGAAKIEFLQGSNVVSTMDVTIKTGLNRFQWGMNSTANANNAAAGAAGAGGGGRGRGAGAAGAGAAGVGAAGAGAAGAGAAGAGAAGAAGAGAGGIGGGQFGGGGGGRGGAQGGAVPFVVGGRGGGGFGGGGGGLVEPGTYVVRLTIGDKVYTTSVQVLEDIWMQSEK
jgi:photosystem II stability/assembly factor-like uncharacterized protein